jgi:hypothetical protein
MEKWSDRLDVACRQEAAKQMAEICQGGSIELALEIAFMRGAGWTLNDELNNITGGK